MPERTHRWRHTDRGPGVQEGENLLPEPLSEETGTSRHEPDIRDNEVPVLLPSDGL